MKWIALILGLLFVAPTYAQVVPGQAASKTDKYGGLLNVLTPGGATGHWRKYKQGTRWLLVDPNGHPLFGIGASDLFVLNFTAGVLDAKYGNHSDTWGPQQNRRMKAWGFNVLADGTDMSTWPQNLDSFVGANWPDGGYQPAPMPFVFTTDSFLYSIRDPFSFCAAGARVKDIFNGENTTYFTSYAGGINPDPYDPCYSTWLNGMLTSTSYGGANVVNLLNSPWTIAVELGEADHYYGFQTAPSTEGFTTIPPGQQSLNVGALVLAESPWQTYNTRSASGSIYSTDRQLYAKQVGLQNFLTARYATIGALNTAWGSTYTGFGTDGTNQTQTIGTGNGSNLGPFSTTLTFTPDHGSVWVKVGATVVAGADDCCVTSPANLLGATVGSGTVNFSTKVITITFSAGNAPGNGVLVTADYYKGGWGIGNGVMDEDGHHAWMPQTADAWGTLAGLTATMQTDLLDWFQAYADKMFKVPHDAVKSLYPNMMYWGANQLAGYCNPPPKPVLKAAANYLDAVGSANTICNQAQDQAVLDDYATYLGDIPLTQIWFLVANADSPYSSTGFCCYSNSATQNARGSVYQTVVDAAYAQTVSIAGPQHGTQPNIMVELWAWQDDPVQMNSYGLVSSQDNAYDGRESVIASGVDPWGYSTGGETGNWGSSQPSYVPRVQAENFKIAHQLEAALFSPGSNSTNLALDKPVSCSSEVIIAATGSKARTWVTQGCGRASDGDTATTWQPLAANPQSMRIDMVGSPSVSKIILRWGAIYATAYTLDWSDDGLSWTTAFTQAAGAGGVETDTFTGVSHRYWRGNFTARSGAGSLQLQEIEPYVQ